MSALRVYVAASSVPDQMSRANAVSERLRESGVELTSTWIANVADVGDANPRTATREQRGQWSDACLTGVEQADVVLLLMPPPGTATFGAGVELGYAVARDKRVIASGDTRRTIFCGMEQVEEVENDEDAIASALVAREWREEEAALRDEMDALDAFMDAEIDKVEAGGAA